MSAPTNIERHHYAKLMGHTIIGINWESIDGQAVPVLLLNSEDRDGNTATITVLCEAEGNGPGHLKHNL